MTRKHYEAIAYNLRTTRENIHSRNHYIVDAIAQAMANDFMKDNPKFDRARFLQACGIDQSQT